MAEGDINRSNINTAVLLQRALEILFTPAEENGFWDGNKIRIIARLEHDKDWHWHVHEDTSDRYGAFALSMVLLACYCYDLELSAYEHKIRSYLNYIKERIRSFSASDITYGVLNSLVLGSLVYPDISCTVELRHCLDVVYTRARRISDNQDVVCFIGLSLLVQYTMLPENKTVEAYLSKHVQHLISCQTYDGFFNAGDVRYLYHQRAMYVLWALAFVSRIFMKEEIQKALERSITMIWKLRREAGVDDAFLWHPRWYWARLGRIPVPLYVPYSADYLFECHQTFFANTVSLYQKFFNTSQYQEEKQAALSWIFGKNRIEKDLTTVTGLGIPARIMRRNGELFVAGENFKGSYEVGSYIFTLTESLHR